MNGNYNHTIDAKGRLFIPAKLRDELGERFYVTKGLDNCLFVYSEESWRDIAGKLKALPLSKSRHMQRMFFANAATCELDAQGRIVIPQILRKYAGLVKEVTIVGVFDRAEIWDKERWAEINDNYDSDIIAREMDELGF